MLPENRAASARPWRNLAIDDQTRGHEKARSEGPIHRLHDAGRFQRREGEQEQKSRHELRPAEKRHPHPGHARSTELNDRGGEVHRTKERRGNVKDHPDQPQRLAVEEGMNSLVRHASQRRIRRPTRLAAPPGTKKLTSMMTQHKEAPIARHIDPRKGHIRSADLQRHHEITESRECHGHDAEKHHDRAVHRAERVIAGRVAHPSRHRRDSNAELPKIVCSRPPITGTGTPGLASCQRITSMSIKPKKGRPARSARTGCR